MYSLVNLKKYFGKNRFDAFPFEKKVSDMLTDEVGKVYTLPLPTCTPAYFLAGAKALRYLLTVTYNLHILSNIHHGNLLYKPFPYILNQHQVHPVSCGFFIMGNCM